MGIRSYDLRQYVIRPTLQRLGLWSLAAENLLLGTAAQESKLGYYLHQLEGPALGLYQIEPSSYQDVWQNFINFRADLKSVVLSLVSKNFKPEDSTFEIVGNLNYATAIARILYFRVPAALPHADDVEGLGRYWKQYYNTLQGEGAVSEFIENYQNLIMGE